ncbi:hypothetical protein CYMTET_20463 [Cymbomonas tetramitiformis]|uniref:Uncharacterized protein n=1 Tax=Cymbomonas tetramitiformis TaxID=36881 RepID=A0AAE0G454_9CHLO|nr:hypothetical protein CYMTET_20463 [Cymbomonas tetramitiformis]
MKRITSKMNNGNKRHKWACTAVKLSFLHRDRGDELKVDAALMAGNLSGYKLFGERWPKDYKFSGAEIASFKELQYDPVSGRKVKPGRYWETFNETIIRERIRDEIIELERAEGAGPGTKRGSVFSPGCLLSIKKALSRAEMYDQLTQSSFLQHRLLPGQFAFGCLPKWRVNGRGSLANERAHAKWNPLVTRNMGKELGVLLLLEGTSYHNAAIREVLKEPYGALTYDWWVAQRCNELSLQLHGEERYSLRLPPEDNGESFIVPGLLDFTRPSVAQARTKALERAAACISSQSMMTAKRQKALKIKAGSMKRLHSNVGATVGIGAASMAPGPIVFLD